MTEKRSLTTYDDFILDSEQKNLLENEYQELILSELFLALMDEDQVSVRKLAKAAKVSPTIIQELRTGKKENLTLKTFLLLIDTLGYSLVLEKREKPRQSSKRIGRKKRKGRFSLSLPSSIRRRRRRRVVR